MAPLPPNAPMPPWTDPLERAMGVALVEAPRALVGPGMWRIEVGSADGRGPWERLRRAGAARR